MALKLVAIVIGYFLGNFSTSLIVSKLFGNIDIRKHGSGNAGTTNVLRTLGVKAALITLIGDAFKGFLAIWIGQKIGGENIALLCGIAVVMGHNWPALFGFKGGKGIATTIGVGLTINFSSAIICILIGIVIIIKTKYVSLASMVSISLFSIFLLLMGYKYFMFSVVLAAMAIFRHRANIKRLMNGTESKFGEKSSIR